MLKQDEYIYAAFEPSDTKLLTSTSNGQHLVEYPLLTSALSGIFPHLLLFDSFLEIITWTNDDPYQNFLLIVAYSVLVMNWQTVGWVLLPLLIALSFSAIVWSVSSVLYDAKFDEKPTVDEVLYTLHNITVRCQLFFRPAGHLELKFKNFSIIFISMVLLTPIHVIVVKSLLGPQRYFWLLGLFALTYHSPWAFTIRRLFWRLVYIRIIAGLITGVNVNTLKVPTSFSYHESFPGADEQGNEDTIPLLADFVILKKVIASPTQLKQVVRFDIVENERRWVGFGWSKYLYPSERSNYCSANTLQASTPMDEFTFPLFGSDLHSYLWQWIDDRWILDTEFNKGKNSDGWVYYDSNWENGSADDGFFKYTRSRKWYRKADLTIDKHEA